MAARDANNATWYILRYASDFMPRAASASDPAPPQFVPPDAPALVYDEFPAQRSGTDAGHAAAGGSATARLRHRPERRGLSGRSRLRPFGGLLLRRHPGAPSSAAVLLPRAWLWTGVASSTWRTQWRDALSCCGRRRGPMSPSSATR